LKSLVLDTNVFPVVGTSNYAETSAADARVRNVSESDFFCYSLYCLEVIDAIHRKLMKEVNLIKECKAYCKYITEHYKLMHQFCDTLKSEKKNVLLKLFQFCDVNTTRLNDDKIVEFMVDVLQIYLNYFCDMVMKHDKSFILDTDELSVYDNSVSQSNYRIKLVKTTSRVVERTLGNVMKELQKNNKTRIVVLKTILRLRPLQFNWMEQFTPEQRRY
jgi:hypothetical protein